MEASWSIQPGYKTQFPDEGGAAADVQPPVHKQREPIEIPRTLLTASEPTISIIESNYDHPMVTIYMTDVLLSKTPLPYRLHSTTNPVWERCCKAVAAEGGIEIPPGQSAVETLFGVGSDFSTTLHTDARLREILLTQCINTVTAHFFTMDLGLLETQPGALLQNANELLFSLRCLIPEAVRNGSVEFESYNDAISQMFAFVWDNLSVTPDWYATAFTSVCTKLDLSASEAPQIPTAKMPKLLDLIDYYLRDETIRYLIDHPPVDTVRPLAFDISDHLRGYLWPHKQLRGPLLRNIGSQLDCEFDAKGTIIKATPRETPHPSIPVDYPRDYPEKLLNHLNNYDYTDDCIYASPQIQALVKSCLLQVQVARVRDFQETYMPTEPCLLSLAASRA